MQLDKYIAASPTGLCEREGAWATIDDLPGPFSSLFDTVVWTDTLPHYA